MAPRTTPLGRAVAGSIPLQNSVPPHEPHVRSNSLRDLILGGQYGLVNMLGIILGMMAAGGSTHVLIATGLAAAFTESISMGAVTYTSFGTERDAYRAEQDREREEVETV